MSRVALVGLKKSYRGAAALDGATLDIEAGELVAALGPSRSGKSTLGLVVAGLERLDEGEIFVDQRMVQSLPPRARDVALVFEDDALRPRAKIVENLKDLFRARGMPRSEREPRSREALAALGIEALGDEYPESIAALDRRRVALARALAIAPKLLVMDEPFGALDAAARLDFELDLRRIRDERGLATLVLTREPRVAFALADRVALLDAGKVVQIGAPEYLYNRPCDAFAARFLGAVNLVEGRVDRTDARGSIVVRTPWGRLAGSSAQAALADGAAATIAIRPENLSLAPLSTHDANRFAARVERLIFEGPGRRVLLRGSDDGLLEAFASQASSRGLRVGQTVTLWVAPESVVVLPGRYATTSRHPAPSPLDDEPAETADESVEVEED